MITTKQAAISLDKPKCLNPITAVMESHISTIQLNFISVTTFFPMTAVVDTVSNFVFTKMFLFSIFYLTFKFNDEMDNVIELISRAV